MTKRTVTLLITEAEFNVLVSAVAQADAEWEAEQVPGLRRDRETLDRVWTKIKRAWYARARASA